MKMIVRRTALAVCTLVLAVILPTAASAACTRFDDVPESADCYESVMYLAEHEITQGTGNGYFSPDAPVALVNAAGVNINDYLLALRQVPEPMLAAFNVAGWTYRIDFDYISELSKQLNMSCIGATNYSQKTIYLSDASATLHEFGHFLDWQLGFPAEHERLYLAEAQNSGLRDYAKTNAGEYFADCFDYWVAYSGNEKRMETFRNAAPQTWAYMKKLATNNWGA
mgnify:CR=1 FL=1